MPEVIYTGHLSVTYMDYTDLDTGRVLFVEPGGVYNIQATGFNAPDIPANDFILTENKDDNEDLSVPAPEVEEE